jgi:hypothetical protein
VMEMPKPTNSYNKIEESFRKEGRKRSTLLWYIKFAHGTVHIDNLEARYCSATRVLYFWAIIGSGTSWSHFIFVSLIWA